MRTLYKSYSSPTPTRFDIKRTPKYPWISSITIFRNCEVNLLPLLEMVVEKERPTKSKGGYGGGGGTRNMMLNFLYQKAPTVYSFSLTNWKFTIL